jgi:hypothetical protein
MDKKKRTYYLSSYTIARLDEIREITKWKLSTVIEEAVESLYKQIRRK